jgi:hypothetical protein
MGVAGHQSRHWNLLLVRPIAYQSRHQHRHQEGKAFIFLVTVRRQRSNQLSYVPRLFFNNLVICHIESSGSKSSLFSLSSTISLLWPRFGGHHMDTKTTTVTTRSSLPEEIAFWCLRFPVTEQKDSLPIRSFNAAGRWCWCNLGPALTSRDLMDLGMGAACGRAQDGRHNNARAGSTRTQRAVRGPRPL